MSPHLRPVFFVACLACCFLVSPLQLTQAQNLAPSAEQETVPLISAQDFSALITKKKSVFILDVRQQEEYDAGHINNAILIPLNTLPNRISELPKNKKIIVYCGSGKRSAKAVSFLREKGYSNALSLAGGYMGWAEYQKTGK